MGFGVFFAGVLTGFEIGSFEIDGFASAGFFDATGFFFILVVAGVEIVFFGIVFFSIFSANTGPRLAEALGLGLGLGLGRASLAFTVVRFDTRVPSLVAERAEGVALVEEVVCLTRVVVGALLRVVLFELPTFFTIHCTSI